MINGFRRLAGVPASTATAPESAPVSAPQPVAPAPVQPATPAPVVAEASKAAEPQQPQKSAEKIAESAPTSTAAAAVSGDSTHTKFLSLLKNGVRLLKVCTFYEWF
jgi:protein-disulfide isomerase